MAGELNVFKTVAVAITTTPTVVYTAPADYTAIVLMAHVSNVTSNTASVTFSHTTADGVTVTELLKDYAVPGNDATSATTGKLVIETGQKIRVSSNTASALKVVLSILESANA